jgi:hypothetical protein
MAVTGDYFMRDLDHINVPLTLISCASRGEPRMSALQAGDAVQTKGGSGESMTIEKIERLHGLELAHVSWVDAKTNKHYEEVLLLSMLEHAAVHRL